VKKLRIAIWHNLPSGGGKRQLYSHVKGLVKRGHYVESWCPDTADVDFLPLREIISEHVLPLSSRSTDFDLMLRPANVVEKLLAVMEDHCRECAQEINRGGFDVLFVNACKYLRTSPISKYVFLPSTIYLGEPYRWFYEALPELPWIGQHDRQLDSDLRGRNHQSIKHLLSCGVKRLLRPWAGHRSSRRAFDPVLMGTQMQAHAEREYARSFDSILVNSIYSRESILRAYNLPSCVCYLGIDTDHFKPSGEAKERFVIGLGTIYHAKGVDRAIRAIAAIPIEKRPSLVWIGNGASEHDLENYVHLAAQLTVDFRPKVNASDAEVISYLSRAAAIIYTSRLEPFGLAPLEANACGTAVVGIAEAGVRETVLDGVNGFLASDETPSALGGLIASLTESADAGREMGARAREHVERHWSMKACIDKIEEQLIALFSEDNCKRLIADLLQSTGAPVCDDVRAHLDEFEVENGMAYARGWGFIEGVSMFGAQSFLAITDGERRELHRAHMTSRPDVSRHFGETTDYDNCGFVIDGRTQTRQQSRVDLIITSQNQVRITSLNHT